VLILAAIAVFLLTLAASAIPAQRGIQLTPVIWFQIWSSVRVFVA
jgi:hypothetical protein